MINTYSDNRDFSYKLLKLFLLNTPKIFYRYFHKPDCGSAEVFTLQINGEQTEEKHTITNSLIHAVSDSKNSDCIITQSVFVNGINLLAYIIAD